MEVLQMKAVVPVCGGKTGCTAGPGRRNKQRGGIARVVKGPRGTPGKPMAAACSLGLQEEEEGP